MSILKLEHVSYRYEEGNDIIHDLSLDFELGKTYAIKGKSGSGKTTLLSLLAGLETATEGKITFDGKELQTINLDHYRSSEIGIVFQSFNLLPTFTAIENVILSMDINHLNIENKKEYAYQLLERVGLSRTMGDRRVLKLSGGEQQRVAIARSLSYQPKLILADEPTGNLDSETEQEIMNILSDLAHKENKCVIIVTHSKNVSNQVDTVYELKRKIT
ncbi:MAG: ABC transporter ATP-binding protein [Firmicutes bacterium]|nr:ABC transporter ATP-binding protein [Bacillota bacterium]